MAEFVMPSLGADMEAGTLVAWRKRPGDRVSRGDIVAEVDTDKGVIEVESFHDGVVEALLVPEGSRVPVGTPLARLGDPGVPTPAASSPAVSSPAASPPRSSPAARRLARELGVDLGAVRGSGPGGVITHDDVAAAGRVAAPAVAAPPVAAPAAPITAGPEPAARPPAPPPTALEPEGAATAGQRMRRAIAAAMERSSREVPHYHVSLSIDVRAATELVARENEARPIERRLVLGALLVRAVAVALRRFPDLNARWEGGRVVPAPEVHVGMAIALRDGGLVVPAVANADRLGLDATMEALADLTRRARAGELRSGELSRGTITITSLGERGADTVAGLVYPPQVALVGFGRVAPRPWVDEAGGLCVRPALVATLAADHRASDGHRGSLFLAELARGLEKPEVLR